MGGQVLLYVPNIIGYLRLLLIFISWIYYDLNSWYFVLFYTTSVILDAFDGYAARKLNQTSAFGAWLDVVVDNIGRGMLWSSLYKFGYAVAALEWLTFVCCHSIESHWKEKIIRQDPPWFVTAVMKNNFRTPTGYLAMGGIHVLPIWLYGYHFGVLSALTFPGIIQTSVLLILSFGRLLGFTVEIWCIYNHIENLLQVGQ